MPVSNVIYVLILSLFSSVSYAQMLSEEEMKLYNSLMEYRKEMGLKSIPLSPALTIVAQTHVKDLAENKPDLGDCNAHSWSSNGNWSSCCYTSDHAESECMWSKPSELTSYKGMGYEIACGSNVCCSSFTMTAEYALKAWKKSVGHNQVMINKGVWKGHKWNAVGVGLYKGFAVIWFGTKADTTSEETSDN